MNIVVLVKQVPAVSDIQIDAKDHNLVRVGAPSMLNPVDMNAIEAAVAVKEAVGGTVTLVTMGTALAGEVMRQGIAIGADKGVLVSDERMAGSDTLATGKFWRKRLKKSAALTWSLQASARPMAIRARSSGCGPASGHVPLVLRRIDRCRRRHRQRHAQSQRRHRIGRSYLAGGLLGHGTMNTPRQPKVRGTMMAKKAVFDVLRLEDLGLDAQEAGKAGSATQVTELFAPEPHPVGTMISGATAAEAAKNLVGTLAEKKLL